MEKKTTVLKLSLLNSVEETKNAIAQALGIAVEQVQLSEEQISQIETQGKERLQIRNLIAPFYDPIEKAAGKHNAQKRKELIDIGHFLYFLNNGTTLVECGERPDFIVECNGRKIGVELTELTDEELAAQVNVLKKVFEQATLILRSSSNDTGIYNVFLDPGAIAEKGKPVTTFSKLEKAILSQQIADHIKAIIEGQEVDKLPFIDKVVPVPHNSLDIVVSVPYFNQKYSEERFINTLQKKEQKLEAYKKESGLEAFWLLIIINGVSAESNIDITPEMLPVNHGTLFEKVYLFNFFKHTIIEGKNNG